MKNGIMGISDATNFSFKKKLYSSQQQGISNKLNDCLFLQGCEL